MEIAVRGYRFGLCGHIDPPIELPNTGAAVTADPLQPLPDIAQRIDRPARRAISVSRNISI
jgi:hypothetical protein